MDWGVPKIRLEPRDPGGYLVIDAAPAVIHQKILFFAEALGWARAMCGACVEDSSRAGFGGTPVSKCLSGSGFLRNI